jgi:tetratricopeptide (TPR) repeat protein
VKNYNDFLKAKNLIKQNNYRDAEIILKRLYKFEPENSIIKFELARLLIKNQNSKEEGKRFLEELLDTKSRTYAMLELGRLEAVEENIPKAREYFEELIKSNSQNKIFAIFELGRIEEKEENIDKAIQYFEKILDTKNEIYALNKLVYLEIKIKNYMKAYNYLKKLLYYSDLDDLNIKEINHIIFYLKYKLNLLTEEDKKNNSYFCIQLINYDEEKTIEHIKFHLDENDNKRIHTNYYKSLNINILFNDIKFKISNMLPIKSSLTDKYIIEYDYIVGSINNVETNALEVVTYSNTKDIITMYPIYPIKNKKNEEDMKVKQIKRESQIDKFNRKYNLK